MRIQTPVATLSYPHLFTASVMKGETDMTKAKFSAAFVFPAGTDLTEMKSAVLEVAREKFGVDTDQLIAAKKLYLPFRTDGDEKGYPEGSVYVGARSKDQPVVVSLIPDPNNLGPDGKGRPMVITSQVEVYAGIQVRGLLSVYAYDTSGNRGVTFGLEGVQKIADGERLDNRVNPVNVFEADPDAAASFDLSEATGEPVENSGQSVLDLM